MRTCLPRPVFAAALAWMALCLGAPPAARLDAGQIGSILSEAKREPPPSAQALGAKLARLGTPAIPDLFAVLAHGLGAEKPLSGLEEEALLEALASFGTRSLRPFLDGRLGSPAPPEELIALLRVLGRGGSSQDLFLVRRTAEAGETGALEPAIHDAVAGILRRDARGVDFMGRWILESPLDLGGTLVRAVGASGCGAALPTLAGLLGYQAALDPLLIPEIGRIAEVASKPIDPEVTETVAKALESDDPQLVREAALALGRAEDCDSAARLIELLGHENRGVREAASWALGKSTGLRFRGDSLRWTSWLRNESDWFRETAPELSARLRSHEPGIAVQALGQFSQRRYRRHELAREVEAALEHESASVRALACHTLARLSSTTAVPALRAVLDDPDEGVVRAALAALETLGASAEKDGRPPETPAPAPLKKVRLQVDEN